MSMFPDPVKRTLGMYQALFQAILCTTIPAKRKRSTEIESIQKEQTMSGLKHATPSDKESTTDSDNELQDNSVKVKKFKNQ